MAVGTTRHDTFFLSSNGHSTVQQQQLHYDMPHIYVMQLPKILLPHSHISSYEHSMGGIIEDNFKCKVATNYCISCTKLYTHAFDGDATTSLYNASRCLCMCICMCIMDIRFAFKILNLI